MTASLYDNERIAFEILRSDEPRLVATAAQAADSEAAPLAECVALEAEMAADDHAVGRFDRPRPSRQPGSDESAEGPLAYKADAR